MLASRISLPGGGCSSHQVLGRASDRWSVLKECRPGEEVNRLERLGQGAERVIALRLLAGALLPEGHTFIDHMLVKQFEFKII